MRAAIYARYSSDLQSSASIEDQVRLCGEHLEREGWTLAQSYIDRATSGASMLRPGLQGLIEDAMAANFDVVVAEALDRLSRDQADIAALYKRLTFAGVHIITLAEGEISELHVGLKGTMNQLFLKDLADKTRRGLRGRVEAGKSGGGLCFGYSVLRTLGPDGAPAPGEREINEDEAEVVRRIFQDYSAGQSPRAIAKTLNGEGVKGPSGKAWGASTIHGNPKRGTGILNNELYIGRLIWNRLRYVKDPETGKRVSRPNPETEWVIHEVPELRIVGDSLWRATKARQAAASLGRVKAHDKSEGFWSKRRPKNLLSGLITCGVCGEGIIQVGRDYLGCAAHRNKGTCDHAKTIRRDRLEDAVLEGLRSRLVLPDMVEEFCSEFIREANRIHSEHQKSVSLRQKELARVEREIRNMIEIVKAGLFTASMKPEMEQLERRREALAAEIDAAGSNAEPPALHPALADLYVDKVERLRYALQVSETRAEAMDAIRSLIERIVIVPDPETGGSIARVEGDLATLLGFAEDKTKNARSVGYGRSTKLVAGAGFEPAAFRL